MKKRRSLFQKAVSLFTGFLLVFQSLTPGFFISSKVFAEDEPAPTVTEAPAPTQTPASEPTQTPQPKADQPLAETQTVTPTTEPTVIPTAEPTITEMPAPTQTPTDTTSNAASPTVEPTQTSTPTPTPSPWTFENVKKDTPYEHNGVTLTFTSLPESSGNIKIEEITLNQEQMEQTGALSDKAYDITSDMTDGEFAYTLSLPIPESAKDKNVEIKYAEKVEELPTAQTIESVTKTETSISTENLDHFTIFIIAILSTTPNLRINEFVYNPTSGTSEWVELYNKENSAINLTDWRLQDGDGNKISLSGDVSAHGFITFDINNRLDNTNSDHDGDTIYLEKKLIGNLYYVVDQVTYYRCDGFFCFIGSSVSGTILKGKSIGRTTDGGSDWTSFSNPTKNLTNIPDTTAPTATVSYSNTSPTNLPVTATMIPSEPVTVTSEGGTTTHVFNKNGTFTFTFKDASNNIGSVIATVENIDTTPPDAPHLISPINGATVNGNPTQSWSLINDAHHYVYESYDDIDGTNSIYSTTTTTPTKLVTGNQTITFYWRVKAVDTVGNTSPWSDMYKLTVDNAIPTSAIFVQGDLDETKNITTNNRWFESFDNVDLKIATGNQTTDTIQYQLLSGDITCPDQSSSAYVAAIHNTNLSSLINAKPDGIYSVCYFAKDQAGNQESVTHKEILKKDNTNPSFTIDSVSGNEISGVFYNKAEIQTKITVTDAESGYSHARYDLYNADANHNCTTYVGANQDSISSVVNPATRTLTKTGLSDGNYCLRIWVYDNVQNKAWTDSSNYNSWVKFAIDTTIPVITVNKFVTNDNTPKLTGTINDPNVPVSVTVSGKTYAATNKGNSTWELIGGSITPTLADGTYDVTASATDTAGNTGIDATTNELTIDTKAPNALFKHYIDGTEFTGGVAYVNNLNRLTFTSEYTDTSPSSQLLKDSYVIFDAQDDGTFKFSANGKKAYCAWRTEPNLVDLTGNAFSLTTQEAFTNCIASLGEGEYYMTHQVYDNAVRKDIPSITQFRDVLGLHFVIDTTAPAAPTAVFTSNGKQIPTNGYTNAKTFTFTLSSTDATRYQLKYWNSISGDPFNGDSHAWNPKNLSGTYTDTFTRGEGTHYFAFSACDTAGNCSAYATPFVITYDKTIPVANITAPVTSFLAGTVDIKGTVTDTNPHHYWLAIYRLSDNTEIYSTVINHSGQINNQLLYTWNTTKEADGAYRIKFAERDAADNRSPDDIVDVTIDNTAPTSMITSPFTSESGSTVYLNDWDGKITGTANDSTSGIQNVLLSIRRSSDGKYFSSDDGWIDGTEEATRVPANGTTTWDFSLADPTPDDYTITSHAIDNAGNVENSYKVTIILDKTIPEVTLSINPTVGDGENGWYKTQPEITLTANDAHMDKIEYQWDSETGTWTTYTAPFKLENEAAHVLYYRAHDLANNYSDTGIKNIAWDKTSIEKAPQNVSVSPNPSNGRNVKVTWEAAKDNSGIDHYTVTWKKDGVGERGTNVSEITREYIIPDTLTEGVWNVKVTAVDKAGFTADASANATVDLTAPAAPTLALTGTGVGSVSLAWNAVEGAIDYSVWYGTTAGVYDYAAHVGNVTSYTIQGLGAGTYYVVVAAYDNVVNRSAFSNEVNTGGAITGAPGATTGPAEGFQPSGSVLGTETTNPQEANGQALGTTTTAPGFSWWFILIGLLLIIIAIYIYYRQRRKNR